jgi:hypothetical protein
MNAKKERYVTKSAGIGVVFPKRRKEAGMDLEQKYGKRYRIFVDDSFKAEKEKNKTEHRWRYVELHGKGGYVYSYSYTELAVVITGSKVANKVRRQHAWKVIQDADDATVFLVPDSEAQVALSIIKPYRKKVLSDQDKARMSEILKRAREQKQK